LIAELVAGELARALGFRMPEIVFINLHEAFGRTEPDEEIQDLLRASVGMNWRCTTSQVLLHLMLWLPQ
jgi:hypothetical protein